MERIYEVEFIKQFNWFILHKLMQLILILRKTLTGAIKQRPLEERALLLMEPSVKLW
jgi:hypothetical protein